MLIPKRPVGRSNLTHIAWLALLALGSACGARELVPPERATDAGPVAETSVCGATMCGAVCADLATDHDNCGRCGHPCADGLSCEKGVCDAHCSSPQIRCDARPTHPTPYCTDLTADPQNCGGCDFRCSERANSDAVCVGSACGIRCSAGFADCNGVRSDGCEAALASDPKNCGGCDHACAIGASCLGGTCGGVTCASPLRVCSGACMDVSRDPSNCGDCGIACAPGLACVAGSCATSTCPAPARMCGASCVDVARDVANCGDCGHACKPAESCSGGACVVSATCSPPSSPCGIACVDLGGDVANCGTCAHRCASGELCGGGTCSCLSPHIKCAGGCVDTSSDPANCGSCGSACPIGTACSKSSCVKAVACRTGAPSVLFYGPTGSVESPYVPAATTKVATDAEWRAMTTSDFASYALIVIGESPVPLAPSQLQAAYDTRATWSAAVTGRIAVLGIVPGGKAASGTTGAQTFLKATMGWLTSGPVGTTSLYVASDWGTRDLDYLSSFGLFGESTANGDDVRVGSPTHPMMIGSSDGTLSAWHSSTRTLFSTFPSAFTSLAKGLGGPAGTSPPPVSGLVVLAKDAVCTP